ncbi:MAG: hypothetical protein H7336_15240 [Bacteriovorax sp.]|nr:hypothetical protein [Bacteriovorax sp.]
MKTFLSALLITLSFSAQASVWEDTNSWTVEYEKEFTNWIQTNAVREGMFNDRNSPYYGISTDCADTAYALRAVFAFEHKLPFAISNPSGSRDVSKTLNNKSNKFDYSGTENKRLVAMITEIGDSVGTENLTRLDTFPVAIKSIVPGSIFTYKMQARFGKFIRHTYNIKGINPVGTFDVIYSTQANHASHGDLLRRRDREFENLPNDPWGFRRFKWPEHLNQPTSVIPAELGASNEQYDLARTMDTRTFFKYVGKQLATTTESSSQRLTRLFAAICIESQARITYVNEGLTHLMQTSNACMNYEEFDAYSTPARDGALKEMYLKFQQALLESKQMRLTDGDVYNYANYIFNGKGNVQAELQAACPIAYRGGVVIDLAVFWKRMSADRMSSHPNDIVEVRWGEKTSPATRCKRWY